MRGPLSDQRQTKGLEAESPIIEKQESETSNKRKRATKEDSLSTNRVKKQALDSSEANPTAQEQKSNVVPVVESTAKSQKNVSNDRVETQANRSSSRAKAMTEESNTPPKQSTRNVSPDQVEHTNQVKHTEEDSQAMGKDQSSFLDQERKSGLLLPIKRQMFLRHDRLKMVAQDERPFVVHRSPLLDSDNKRALVIHDSPLGLGDESSPLFERLWNSELGSGSHLCRWWSQSDACCSSALEARLDCQ